MIDCNLIRDLLPLYGDGAVSPETAKIVKEHLTHCPDCRGYYAHIGHVAHTFHEPEENSGYHYSEIVKKIRRRTLAEYAAGVLLLGALCAVAVQNCLRRDGD